MLTDAVVPQDGTLVVVDGGALIREKKHGDAASDTGKRRKAHELCSQTLLYGSGGYLQIRNPDGVSRGACEEECMLCHRALLRLRRKR
jgi:hypothetical protein